MKLLVPKISRKIMQKPIQHVQLPVSNHLESYRLIKSIIAFKGLFSP